MKEGIIMPAGKPKAQTIASEKYQDTLQRLSSLKRILLKHFPRSAKTGEIVRQQQLQG